LARLKILFGIGSLDLGGTESQMTLLVRELKRQGHQCELFVLEAKGPFKSVLEQDGIPVHDGGCDSMAPRAIKAFLLLRAMVRFWLLALRVKPDVLHAYLPLMNFMGSLAGRAAGVGKIITSRRALGTYQDSHPNQKVFYKLANALSDRVTVNSDAVWRDVVCRDGIAPEKLVLIRNGLDIGRFSGQEGVRGVVRENIGLGGDEFGIIKVGNLIPYKGHADLINALPKVLEKRGNARLFLVGEDRGIQIDLERLASSLAVSDRVHFLGRRNDVPSLLMAMDLYVMASHEEGSSNALLEAMAAGLPIVATDVGGNREALDDGRAGLLAPPHDPAALSQAIGKLIADDAMRSQVAAKAKAHAQSYSIPDMVEAHIRLYSQ
jgi:glycosyltransferase involved in cell wall biosynthesis